MARFLTSTLSRTTLYWLMQVVGWGAFVLIWIVYIYTDTDLSGEQGLVMPIVFSCLIGLGLTHLFRTALKHFKWQRLALYKLVLLVFAANVAMAGALVAVITLWDAVFGNGISNSNDVMDLVSIGANMAILFLIWSLIYFVVYAFRNYRHEEIERLRAEQTLRESELARLKSQMNPHFVFNALNSIRALVAEDPNKAQQSITQLSHLLRGFLLSDRHRTVPLREEMRTVMDYLELEKLRYEERLHFCTSLSDGAMDVEVPTMMVQTLVENAIKHGISKRLQGGEIDIRANVENEKLSLEIENDGDLHGVSSPRDGGFGLANTRLRLQLLFGTEAQFDIYQAKPGRVVARVQMPAGPPAVDLLATVSLTSTPISPSQLPLSA